MATLIIEQHGKRQAGLLQGRVLIGRWPLNTIVIDDRAVSRIHAWLGVSEEGHYIADAGSRTGTFVNDQMLAERHVLRDGDQIRIGPALLEHRAGEPPAELEAIDLRPRSAEALSGDEGAFVECACGGPLWLPRHFAGKGKCRYCGSVVRGPAYPAVKPLAPGAKPDAAVAPAADALIAPPAVRVAAAAVAPRQARPTSAIAIPHQPVPRAPDKDQVCGVCHASITRFDAVSSCPSCALVFHDDCWIENQGCSSFGCNQVGAARR